MPFDPTTTAIDPGWYVGRRIAASPAEALQALGDALRADPLMLSMGPDLAVDGVRHRRPGEARGFTGRLRLGPLLGTTRIEVEVEAWSRAESVLSLRPTRRAPRHRADRYFERSVALLGALEAHLLERIVAPEPLEVRRAS